MLPSSPFFTCSPCAPGFSNGAIAEQGLCQPCTSGRYANGTASSVCEQCEAGKYSTSIGATDERSCESCVPGKYAPATGSSACTECPAGSACPGHQTSLYEPCAPGRYNGFSNKTSCLACPQGKYGTHNGSATCLDCPRGTYLNATGSVMLEACRSAVPVSIAQQMGVGFAYSVLEVITKRSAARVNVMSARRKVDKK